MNTNKSKPLTRHAIAILHELKRHQSDFIRRENAWHYYGQSDDLCLHYSGMIILHRRGLADMRRTPSGMNIEHFKLNNLGIAAMNAL